MVDSLNNEHDDLKYVSVDECENNHFDIVKVCHGLKNLGTKSQKLLP